MSEPITVDENKLYYFCALADDKYYTAFIGWIRQDLIKAFQMIEQGQSYVQIRITVGENRFITNVGAPLYLLNYENDDIFNFAGDDEELDLFPSGNPPADLAMESIIDYPTYFNKGVVPLIEFKIFDKFYAQKNGMWVPLLL